MKLTSDEKRKVINCCKENLISDYNFDPTQEYESQWFVRKFDFLNTAGVDVQIVLFSIYSVD